MYSKTRKKSEAKKDPNSQSDQAKHLLGATDERENDQGRKKKSHLL